MGVKGSLPKKSLPRKVVNFPSRKEGRERWRRKERKEGRKQ